MTYKMTAEQWADLAILANRKKKPLPMRPVTERVARQTAHFVIMTANTTTQFAGWKRRGMRFALIELSDPKIIPTRIDIRLKAIRRILAIKTVYNLNRLQGRRIQNRYQKELNALIDRCERLYPCHFLVKGINYEPPKAYVDSEDLPQTQEQA